MLLYDLGSEPLGIKKNAEREREIEREREREPKKMVPNSSSWY